MKTTKVFTSGNSQAVRLPRGFTFKNKEVEIFKRNNEVVLREIPENLSEAFNILTGLPEDFYAEERKDTPPQDREEL